MALSPAARDLLDRLGGADAPGIETMSVADARAMSAELWKAFAAPLPEMLDLRDHDARGVPVRTFTPAPEAGRRGSPLVVHLHGGGWVLGDIDEADPVARTLAVSSGVRVVTVDYRLAPEHPFPAGLDDVMTVLRWANDTYAPSAIAIAGESAGGNLAAAAALRARDERDAPRIDFQLLVYPVLDARCASATYDEFGEGHLLTANAMRWFRDHYVGENTDTISDPYVSPLLADDLTGLPPALVVTAECDPLRAEGEAYAERLREAGVGVVTSRYLGMVHGFTTLPAVFGEVCAAFVEETGWAVRRALQVGDEALDRVDDVHRAQ